MASLLLPLLCLTSLVAAAQPAPPAPFFVLGDSSVGCTLNTFLYPLLHTRNSSCPNLLLPDLLTEKMGLPPLIPFYAIDASDPDAWSLERRGINFGAEYGRIVNDGPSSLLFQGLHTQLTLAFDAIQMLQLALARVTTADTVSNHVFYVSFGKDDYVDLLSHESDVVKRYGRRGLASLLVPLVIQAVEDLYYAGARKVVVVGVIPLGCAPLFAVEEYKDLDRWGCTSEINDLVMEYNGLMNASVSNLSSELPGAKLVFCDVYEGLMKIISSPRHYGFEEERNACCDLSEFGGLVGCLSDEMACHDPKRYVWWDPSNPTAAVNALLANWSWSGYGARRICTPLTISQLVSW